MVYLTTHSTHFCYGYMVSDIWWRTIQIAREETWCRRMGYSFRLAARVLLYASSHRQDNTYHGRCYTSHGALAGTRNSSMCPPWRIDPMTHRTMSKWLLPRSYISLREQRVIPFSLYCWRWSTIKIRPLGDLRNSEISEWTNQSRPDFFVCFFV